MTKYFTDNQKELKELNEWVKCNNWVEVDENNFITKECLDKMNKEIENFNKAIVSVDLADYEYKSGN